MAPDYSILPTYAIIVAGGSSRRCPGPRAKQFLQLRGLPLYLWSVTAFAECSAITGIVLVGPATDESGRAAMSVAVRPFNKVLAVTAGGPSRTASVACGLKALHQYISPDQPAQVLVHDGARPLVRTGLITRVAAAIDEKQVVIPVTTPSATIKELDTENQITNTLDRTNIGLAQTPQGLPLSLLQKGLDYWQQQPQKKVTDEGSLIEMLPPEQRRGVVIRAITGEERNLKITVPEDLRIAEALLTPPTEPTSLSKSRPQPARATGFGYDVHAFTSGRALILGGIEIPDHPGLAGHSDADVLIHALVDAILGAVGAGDIGRLFPDHDPAYKNACSLDFLKKAAALAQERGFAIEACDVTVVAQSPKLTPFFPNMTKKLTEALNGHHCQLNLKATTTEGLGFTGRREGIAACAVATVTAV